MRAYPGPKARQGIATPVRVWFWVTDSLEGWKARHCCCAAPSALAS